MMNYNTFSIYPIGRNGVSSFANSNDYKVYISKRERPVPAKKIETVDIPGRRDSLIYDYDEYENTTITYHCFCTEGYPENVQKLLNILIACNGWVRLEDSYMNWQNSEYTYGYYAGGVSLDEIANYTAGSFDIVFNVVPQIYGFTVPVYIDHPGTDETTETTLKAPEGYAFKYYPDISFSAQGAGSITAYDPIKDVWCELEIKKSFDSFCQFDSRALTLRDGGDLVEDKYWECDDFYLRADGEGNIQISVKGAIQDISINTNYYRIA